MNLARFPRLKCGHRPTPLELMPNVTEDLGGPNLWIKRDDCTGLATGGNKTRKLECLIGATPVHAAGPAGVTEVLTSPTSREASVWASTHDGEAISSPMPFKAS